MTQNGGSVKEIATELKVSPRVRYTLKRDTIFPKRITGRLTALSNTQIDELQDLIRSQKN